MHVFTSRISSLDVSNGAVKHLAAPKGSFANMSLSPDGKMLAFLGARVDGPDRSTSG